MAVRRIPAEIGGIPILVEAVTVAGDEETSRMPTRQQAAELFDRAQAVIESMAKSTAEMARKVAVDASRPDQVEVQFGLKFSTQAGIVFASAATEASLAVKIIYGRGASEDEGDENRRAEAVVA
ncbi:CU044_2847 family protein [Micromonospora aurantiaca (nom. illeg.)]|uniref:CU044_2847 family protein n=1 Tax=Micromonospora aurantiaca (nom. illeg.) TaxID=47850 RepID=UPI003EBE1927